MTDKRSSYRAPLAVALFAGMALLAGCDSPQKTTTVTEQTTTTVPPPVSSTTTTTTQQTHP